MSAPGRLEAGNCIGVTPYPQPSPAKNPGGDCFACATYALVRHFLPSSPETFESVWNRYLRPVEPHPSVTYPEGAPSHYLSNCWIGYGVALESLGLAHRYELVTPDYDPCRRGAAFFSGYLTSWHNALAGHIDCGHVLLASIQFDGKGPIQRGGMHDTDHAILVDGWRKVWRPVEAVPGASRQDIEYHVVCSAKGGYWIDQDDLVWKHGLAAWIAVTGVAYKDAEGESA